MIRRAEPKDVDACVDLCWMTMPVILHYFFGDERNARRALRTLFLSPRPSLFSWHIQWVMEKDGRIASSLSVAPGFENENLTRGVYASIPALARELGWMDTSRAAWRSIRLARHSTVYQPDEMIGYRCAVHPQYRGGGILTRMWEKFHEEARSHGLRKVAFGVEADNVVMKRFMVAWGMTRVSTCDRAFFRKYGLADVNKYVKEI